MVGAGATVSVAAVPFFDFITIATIRCSSMRKARTILQNNENNMIFPTDVKVSPTEVERIWHIVIHHKYVKQFSSVLSFPYVPLDEML